MQRSIQHFYTFRSVNNVNKMENIDWSDFDWIISLISDAFLLHGSELHLYSKINIENVNINTQTVAIFRAQPTCIAQQSCGECVSLRHKTEFDCLWCEAAGHCSDGADRYGDSLCGIYKVILSSSGPAHVRVSIQNSMSYVLFQKGLVASYEIFSNSRLLTSLWVLVRKNSFCAWKGPQPPFTIFFT